MISIDIDADLYYYNREMLFDLVEKKIIGIIALHDSSFDRYVTIFSCNDDICELLIIKLKMKYYDE